MAKLKKYCDVGAHEVDSLFHSKTKERPSCCNSHKPRTPIKRKQPLQVTISGNVISVIRPPKPRKAKSGTITLRELLVKAETVFNRWIRKRDKHTDNTFKCISCGFWRSVKDMDAGHFFPKTYSATRFHEDNVHGECVQCNRLDPDHLLGYAVNLRAKIGTERFEQLNILRKANHKWDRSALLEIIEKYK